MPPSNKLHPRDPNLSCETCTLMELLHSCPLRDWEACRTCRMDVLHQEPALSHLLAKWPFQNRVS